MFPFLMALAGAIIIPLFLVALFELEDWINRK